jgi:hypothetical protein
MDNIIDAHATTYIPLDPLDSSHRSSSGRFSAFFSAGNSFTSVSQSSTGLLYNGHYIVLAEGARAVNGVDKNIMAVSVGARIARPSW